MVVKRSWMIGKITAKMPNTHTHGSKQGTISEKCHTVSGQLRYYVFQILCKRVKLWLSRGKFQLWFTAIKSRLLQEDGCYPINSNPILCVTRLLRNICVNAYWYLQRKIAYLELQVRKFWLLGKNTFCLRFMDAELRFNACNCAVIVSNLYLVAPVLVLLDQAVEKFAIFVCKYLKLWLF